MNMLDVVARTMDSLESFENEEATLLNTYSFARASKGIGEI